MLPKAPIEFLSAPAARWLPSLLLSIGLAFGAGFNTGCESTAAERVATAFLDEDDNVDPEAPYPDLGDLIAAPLTIVLQPGVNTMDIVLVGVCPGDGP